MPYTEWPYGGTQNIGVTRPNSVDSPLMVAIGNTKIGQAMSDAHVQVYGWIDPAAISVPTPSNRPAMRRRHMTIRRTPFNLTRP